MISRRTHIFLFSFFIILLLNQHGLNIITVNISKQNSLNHHLSHRRLSSVRVRQQSVVDYVDLVPGERFLRRQTHQKSHVSPPLISSCCSVAQKDKDNVD